MKNYIVVVLSLMAALLVGCSLLSLNNDDASCDNPFNGVAPTNELRNSLGFFASSIEYVQPLPDVPFFAPPTAYTVCLARESIDSMLIWSYVYARDYPYLDSKDDHVFFRFIAFLLTPDDVFADGPAYLDGDRVYLTDRSKNDYQVLSATILFDQPPTDKYHSGSFSVEYKDLNNKVCSLTGGRFKLIHTNEDPINGCSVYFSSEFSALKRKHGRFDANNTDNSSIYL